MNRLILALALASGTAPALASASPPAPPEAAAAARRYCDSHGRQILAEFTRLLALPNVASDTEDIGRNAEAVAAMLRRRGLEPRLLEVEGAPPAVYAEIAAPGARRTVTFYAHYDGQPTDPKEWSAGGAPWTPVLRDGPLPKGTPVALPAPGVPIPPEWRLYARSAGDDKAAIAGILAALDSLRAAKIPLAANVKLFFEGEEEAGSPHLEAILRRYASLLATDVWVLCDGPAHQSGRPLVFFGARGTTDADVTVYGPAHGLHSGHYGNWAPNPISMLARLLASMRDDEGRILVPHYLDDVRPLTQEERRALSAVPRVDEELERAFLLGRTEGAGLSLVEAIQRPAINFRGIASGHVGALASNTINPQATASIDFRLVPDQTPETVRGLVESFARAQGYFVVDREPTPAERLSHPRVARFDWDPGYPAYRTSMDLPVSRDVVRLVGAAQGEAAVVLPMLGGSIPMYLFAGARRTPVVGVSIANYDDNQHAPDENLRIGNLWDGVRSYACLLAGLGAGD